jgi:major membrane immunogen (membrane-anchored lipoprotein)
MKRVLYMFGILFLSVLLLTGCGSEEREEAEEESTQSVYKTIDFGSYSGDSESDDFDDLEGKKVTFTNVPTLGGTLGNMSKSFSCRNESSLTIEDDVTYTLTGVVTSTYGTFSVSLRDCTLTES